MQIAKKILLIIIGIVIHEFAVNLMHHAGRSFPNMPPYAIRMIFAVSICTLLLLIKLMPVEQLKGLGEKSFSIYVYPIIFAVLYFIALITVYVVLFGAQYFQLNTGIILSTLLFTLSISLVEEIISRGFLVNYFNRIFATVKNNQKLIAITGGVIFGVAHFPIIQALRPHVIISNMDLFAFVGQAIAATFIGVFICAAFIRRNRILPVIIIHTIFNAPMTITTLIYNTEVAIENHDMIWFFPIITCILAVPFLPLGLKLLNDEQGSTH